MEKQQRDKLAKITAIVLVVLLVGSFMISVIPLFNLG